LWPEEELNRPANLGGLCHRAVAVVTTGQPLGHRRDQRHAEPEHGVKVAHREGVVPHEAVHGRRDVDGFAVVPRAHHARQEVVAQPAGDLRRTPQSSHFLSTYHQTQTRTHSDVIRLLSPYLGQGVGRERCDDHGVGPLAQLDVQDLVADPLPSRPLVLVGVECDAGRERRPVDEVQGGRGRHRTDVGPLRDAAAEDLEFDGCDTAGGGEEDAGPPRLSSDSVGCHGL
jgi:hypothetical protein